MISTLENVPMQFFTAQELNNFHDPDSGSSKFRIDSRPLFSKSATSKTYPCTTSAHKRQKKMSRTDRLHTHTHSSRIGELWLAFSNFQMRYWRTQPDGPIRSRRDLNFDNLSVKGRRWINEERKKSRKIKKT